MDKSTLASTTREAAMRLRGGGCRERKSRTVYHIAPVYIPFTSMYLFGIINDNQPMRIRTEWHHFQMVS